MKPAKKDRYHHGGLRSALLEAAWSVADREGPDALSLRAVAEACGVSHAAPAHHFPSKAALLEALREEAWRRFADVLEETGTLDAAGRAYVRFATRHPRQLALMFRKGAPTPHARRAWDALVARVAKTIGPSRAKNRAELDAMTLTAWAQVHGLAALINDGPLPPGFRLEALEARIHEAFSRAVTTKN